MNINLSAAASKKAKGRKNPLDNSGVSYGLNTRGGGATKSVFDEDDDDSDNSGLVEAGSGRDEVNRSIAAEQAALRQRAQAAMNSSKSNEYDYDGVYDTIQSRRESEKKKAQEKSKDRSSRYVSDLLQAAKNRERERDVIFERKLAKEQKQEELENEEFKGKEKFVTKAYKRKLAERELWASEQEEKRLKEEEEDVSKKTDGEALASFYGNFNRNVAVGGGESSTAKEQKNTMDQQVDAAGETTDSQPRQSPGGEMSFLGGFERFETRESTKVGESSQADGAEAPSEVNGARRETEESKRIRIRQSREEKVEQARIRYFQRHGITDGTGDKRQ